MAKTKLLIITCGVLSGTCGSISEAGITAVNGGTVEWNTAGWTAGVPGPEDAAFINDIAKVLIVEGTLPAVAEGLRIGNVVPQLSMLQMEGSSLTVDFIVLGDAPDSNASFAQTGGVLTVRNTEPIDFEFGNPFNTPAKPSYSLATFAAGKANLGDIRFNLRRKRNSRLAVFGVLPEVSGDSLRFETAEAEDWKPADLMFMLSDAGIAPLRIVGEVNLGNGDRAVLRVDGARYQGGIKEFILIEAGSITGKFKNVIIENLPKASRVKVEEKHVRLVLP